MAAALRGAARLLRLRGLLQWPHLERVSQAAARRGTGVEPVRVPQLVSFGEDAAGELYAVGVGGAVYRFVPR